LSKAHQSVLGQIPFQAFKDAATCDRLVVALVNNEVVGYVLYRTRRRDRAVMLIHLCVSTDARGRGLARALIDDLATNHPAASGIGAWCREDYDATDAWPRLGFDRVGTRAGKARSGTVLVYWWRPVADRSLLICEPDPDGLPVAALDTNIFRDLKEPRYQHVESQALADAWLTDSVELVVTGQVATEIDEAAKALPVLKGAASAFRRLSPRPELWEPIKVQLDERIVDPLVGENDRRHVAQASASGASFVVTRDEALLASAKKIESATGLLVVRPSELLLRLHAGLEGETFQTAALYDTAWSVGSTAEVPTRTDLKAFLQPGERLPQLAMRLHSAVADVARGARFWTIARDQALVAIAAVLPDGDELTVPLFA
jgi:GNAT superfamily N-acetyltransferase